MSAAIRRLMCRVFGHRVVCTYDPFRALLGASLHAPEIVELRLSCTRCHALLGSAESDFSRVIAEAMQRRELGRL